jgi:NitT/TauT family transport system ATP-binding protein
MQSLAYMTETAAYDRSSGGVEVKNVTQVFGHGEGRVIAFEDVSFRAASGRFVVIVGPSGCGKSSLLMAIAGLRRHSSGTIICNGQPVTGPDPNRIGVIFQEASLYPWLSAQENVEFPLVLRHVAKAERRRAALEALALVGLTEAGARLPHELSGGMKQRVAIARGLVQNPPVLLMDEPFAALDEQTRMTMGEELLRIWSHTRKTVIFVTHSLSEAVYLADDVLVMSAHPGRIVDSIPVSLPRPRTDEMMSTELFNRLRARIWRQIRAENK